MMFFPALTAASECRNTAAQAASKGGKPFESMAAVIPVSTSPLPAVLSSNEVFALTAARTGDDGIGAFKDDGAIQRFCGA